jgi:pseudouridine-5'-phosphate glycosidase
MIDLTYSPEVAEAKANGTPIVALESTIITHGMPSPHNIDTARLVEAAIRREGAVPATIAVLNGALHIGLSDAQLIALSQAQDVMKLSRADLPVALARGAMGSTTVAGTMIAAHLAGIEVFATGGIGGVHRGAESSFDISADLRELALTPVTVVAAGAKAILDIPKTLEVLETYGVPVIAMGQDDFPAFWSRSSGLRAPLRAETAREVALAHRMRGQMGAAGGLTGGITGGQLIANPIPHADEIGFDEMQLVVATALADADAANVKGKAVTPFLLGRIYDLTGGRSLTANIALVVNNARLAATIAKELSSL